VNRFPIRLRLTIVFTVAMAIVLAGAGWFLYLRLASDLASSLDQSLRSRAQDLGALVRDNGSLRSTSSALIEPGESFAELVSANGRVLDSSKSIGDHRLLSSAELTRARTKPVFLDHPSAPGLNEPARLLAVSVQRGVLVVGATRENRAEALRSLRSAFFIGGPVALLLAGLGGYFLAGAALRPMEAMRRRAREISTTSLDERLPVPAAGDEVARLGETLNEMLARIEGGLARERRFVADASHELRTPLSLLKTELELALRPGRSPDELKQAIESASAETDRLARIADDLLLLARSEQGQLPLQLEPLDVNDIMQTVAGRFAPRNGELKVEAGETPLVNADRLRLEQAVGNMVDNALRYGARRVLLRSTANNGSVEVHVLDEGAGFPPAFLGHAFERFSRADDAHGETGSGLGLAIVDTVARAHRGSAHAANRPEGGADVWISLPTR
jgi:two-component system, OmpR family, sensor kinase